METPEFRIKQLQREIRPELHNVLITKPIYTPSEKHRSSKLSTRNKLIFDLSDERKSIYNLNTYTHEYMKFLEFMITQFRKINSDFRDNKGDVLTYHAVDDKYAKKLEDIAKVYKDNFLESILSDGRYKTNNGEIYPNFLEDLLYKTRYIQFEKVEKQLGIGNIQEQPDSEFINTIL